MPQRVLWIENDAPTRDEVRRALEANGISVEESASGLDALARAHALPPDLVLGDTQLPDLGGIEVAARLKQDVALARIPFVAVGRDPDEEGIARAAGCDGFVAWPIDLSSLVDQVKTLLSASAGGGAMEDLDPGERGGAGRLRSAFMHDLAHELSTPLTPLTGYLKILLSERLGALSPQQRKVVEGMSSAVRKLTRIVENVADFANLEAGPAAITTSPVDPDVLAAEVVEELREAVRDARLHVEVRPSGGGPVLADRRKLRQALANVVQNAVKFSPHGGEVLIEVVRDAGRLRYAVYDQGPGLSASRQEGIFEPFHPAGRGGDARQPGSGLGLPVARRIAEAHGGRIAVESPPRSQPAVRALHFTGAKFVIEIPAHPATAAPEPPVRAAGS
jgi:signal transduction histidine kinase